MTLKKILTPVAWTFLSSALLLSAPVWAAKAPSASSDETYSATEDENAAPSNAHAASTSRLALTPDKPRPKGVSTKLPTKTRAEKVTRLVFVDGTPDKKPAALTSKKSAPKPVNLAEDRGAYDPVPSDQSDALVKRLHLVEVILRKFARAYDYRVHTVRDLENILARLDAHVAPIEAPAPRPMAADQAQPERPIEGIAPMPSAPEPSDAEVMEAPESLDESQQH